LIDFRLFCNHIVWIIFQKSFLVQELADRAQADHAPMKCCRTFTEKLRNSESNGMIIGLDVGGTHTDVILLDGRQLIREIKIATDPENLFRTLLAGLSAVIEGIDPKSIQRAVLSTTLATNLVAQQKLPDVGIVVAGGPGIDPRHFRTNDFYYTVDGAQDHRGREIQPLDHEQVQSIGRELERRGILYAGVVSKFSVRNSEQEEKMADLLQPYVERVFMGHRFSGNLNFPRRIATTYLNCAVYPVHKKFFKAVQESLAEKGLTMPIHILRPDGGNMNIESSVDHPAQTILSGPSASVMGAISSAPSQGTCLVLDIGGTTTDMAVLIDKAPLLAPLGIEICRYKTLIRALQTESIGIGGDSTVRVREGRLTIGPDRTGKAMAYGGPEPTPTDAFHVLGKGAGGDATRSRAGLEPVAKALNLSVDQTAKLIFETACRTILDGAAEMIDTINSKPVYTVHELWEGSRIRPDHLLILGGPAPQFADQLQTMFNGKVHVVPNYQVANAIGCALARTTCEVTLFADTAQGLATAPGEGFNSKISSNFTLANARDMTDDLLRKKAIKRGAGSETLETEILEESQFNMIRGFQTIGKNIRVRMQLKPGLISKE
jgi:N-methylhydantoinase A/oxoprolinase/acetone carboxylase beta subunit